MDTQEPLGKKQYIENISKMAIVRGEELVNS